MIKLIVGRILAMWDENIFPYLLRIKSLETLIKSMLILKNYNLGPSHTVAIWAENSPNWIITYIASILVGCKVLIIPYDVKLQHMPFVNNLLMKTSTNFLWCSADLPVTNSIIKILLRGIYTVNHIHMYSPPNMRQSKIQCDNLLYDDIKITKTLFKELITEDQNQVALLSVTPGVSYVNEKIVYHPISAIKKLIIKASSYLPFKKLPLINDSLIFENTPVYVKANFSNSHIFSVLLPFIYGNVFVDNIKNADVIVEDSITFKKTWDYFFNLMMISKINSYIYSKRIFRGLQMLILDRIFSRYYGKDKTILIYNANLTAIQNYYIRHSKLNFITTYGMQELGQFISINDYSNKTLNKPYCVGKLLPQMYPLTDDNNGELLLSSDVLFSHYVYDELFTDYAKNEGWFKTGDYGYCEEDDDKYYLMVEGRLNEVINRDDQKINLNTLENIVLSHPLVKEALAIVGDGTIKILVYPDSKMCGAKNIDMDKFQLIMNKMHDKLRQFIPEHYDKLISITSSKPFDKTHNGQIKKSIRNRVEV